MKYAGTYYQSLKLFSKSQSNLNRLCWNIEKWEKQFKFKKNINDVSILMIDADIEWNHYRFDKIKDLYIQFNREMSEAKKQQMMLNNHTDYAKFFSDLTKAEIIYTEINWGCIYEKYIRLAQGIVLNPQELTNYGVEICYRLYPKRSNLFVWVICEEGLFLNLEQNKVDNLKLPQQTMDTKATEYLGKYYEMVKLFK